MKSIYFLFTLFLLFPQSGVCQNYFPLIKLLGGSGFDWGYSVSKTSDNGYIITGDTRSFSLGYGDIWLIKTDDNGDMLWSKTFGTANLYEKGLKVIETYDSCFVIAASSFQPGGGTKPAILIKTDKNGNQIWQKEYQGWALELIQTMDNNLLFSVYGNTDLNLIKLNQNGDTLWTAFYGDYVVANSILELSSDGFILAGSAYDSFLSSHDIWLQKIDINGKVIWTNTIGQINKDEVAYTIDKVDDNSFIVAGWKEHNWAVGYKFIMKIDLLGNIIWEKLAGNLHSYGRAGLVLNDSTYFLFGNSFISINNYEINIYQFDYAGNIAKSYLFDQFNSQQIESVIKENDSTFIAIGSATTSNQELLLLKFDPFLLVTNLLIDKKYNYLEFKLNQNYPNPFNPTTIIKYSIPVTLSGVEGSLVTLKIYDVLGNEVATLVNEEKPVGSYEDEFDGTGLPSGIYFYQLKAGNFIETKKMVLMK